ncbi:MAG TPA: DUF6544 family protein [Gaiellaceae bacterium]|nr:DUF6544 family protein [Gaiellaceae bacterium]
MRRDGQCEIEEFLAGARRPAPSGGVEELPAPVQRWLRWSRAGGAALPATVRLLQQGEFRAGEKRGWAPFRAEQYFTLDPPGFLWRVRLRLAPLLSVTGRDRWVDGDASMRMRLLGLVPVVNASGPALAQGAMLRWLGETIWFPQAVLSPRIAWETVDDESARASLTAGGQTAGETFVFDAEGRPVELRADRFNDARKAILPWVNRNEEFGELGGLRVPVAGEALWAYENRESPYIRWRVTRLEPDVPEPF